MPKLASLQVVVFVRCVCVLQTQCLFTNLSFSEHNVHNLSTSIIQATSSDYSSLFYTLKMGSNNVRIHKYFISHNFSKSSVVTLLRYGSFGSSSLILLASDFTIPDNLLYLHIHIRPGRRFMYIHIYYISKEHYSRFILSVVISPLYVIASEYLHLPDVAVRLPGDEVYLLEKLLLVVLQLPHHLV